MGLKDISQFKDLMLIKRVQNYVQRFQLQYYGPLKQMKIIFTSQKSCGESHRAKVGQVNRLEISIKLVGVFVTQISQGHI